MIVQTAGGTEAVLVLDVLAESKLEVQMAVLEVQMVVLVSSLVSLILFHLIPIHSNKLDHFARCEQSVQHLHLADQPVPAAAELFAGQAGCDYVKLG